MAANGSFEGRWHNESDKDPHVITVSSKKEQEKLGAEKTDSIVVVHGDIRELQPASKVAAFIRARCGHSIPIIYLSKDKVSSGERIKFLDAGGHILLDGEDRHLLPNILTALRRRVRLEAASREPIKPFDGLFIDVIKHEIRIQDRPITLPLLQFRIIALLATSYPKIVKYKILHEIMGDNSTKNSLTVHVSRLNKAIAPFGIVTIRKLGYRLSPDGTN